MKKFKFKLQTLHNVREIKLEKEQAILANIQNEINEIRQYIAEIEKTRFTAIENYTGKLRHGEKINPIEMELNSKHISSLDRLKRETFEQLAEKENAFSEQVKKVATAKKKVKITENLREKKLARHKLELATREQNALDDMVSAKYARQRSE